VNPDDLPSDLGRHVCAVREADDDAALFIAHLAYTGSAFELGKYQSALRAYELALSHARKVGYQPTDVLANRTAARFFGTTSASDTLAWLDENEPHAGRNYFFRAHRAGTLAMLGRFDEARAILAEDRAALAERGGGVLLANITAFESAWVELWAGDPAAAAGFAAEGWRLHTEQGESFALPFAAATVSRTLYELGRFDEAEAWADRAAELPGSVLAKSAQLVERQVRAKLLARRGEHAEAERLVRAAVTISDETEMLDAQGDAHADLAEVLLLGGKVDEAAASLRNALERYERKENLAMADRTRARLARLDDRPPP
jgi:tetratricopeptide (TPR) repeat protein